MRRARILDDAFSRELDVVICTGQERRLENFWSLAPATQWATDAAHLLARPSHTLTRPTEVESSVLDSRPAHSSCHDGGVAQGHSNKGSAKQGGWRGGEGGEEELVWVCVCVDAHTDLYSRAVQEVGIVLIFRDVFFCAWSEWSACEGCMSTCGAAEPFHVRHLQLLGSETLILPSVVSKPQVGVGALWLQIFSFFIQRQLALHLVCSFWVADLFLLHSETTCTPPCVLVFGWKSFPSAFRDKLHFTFNPPLLRSSVLAHSFISVGFKGGRTVSSLLVHPALLKIVSFC